LECTRIHYYYYYYGNEEQKQWQKVSQHKRLLKVGILQSNPDNAWMIGRMWGFHENERKGVIRVCCVWIIA
jgi:hypothetical protein